MLSDFESRGGAAIAVCRLADALVYAGHQVTRIVHSRDGKPHTWRTLPLSVSFSDRLARRVRATFWLDASAIKHLRRALQRLKPDAIHVHNLHSASWPLSLVRVCADYAPVIWTLHDMWSFTGRCAYSGECNKFIKGCDSSCPTPNEYPSLEPSKISSAWEQRRELLKNVPPLVAVSPSYWLAREARSGLWRDHRIEVIPNGLPLDVYRAMDRGEARRRLGIGVKGPALLISAQRLDNPHKGAPVLLEAMRHVKHRPLTLMILGKGELPIADQTIQKIHFGYVTDEEKKVLVYNSANALVHAAVNDNFPNVILESLACGTPIVAFPVGGTPEMVRGRQTGWLASAATPEALAISIDAALTDIERGFHLRDSCRAVAESEYGDSLQMQRYINLFSTLH